MMEWNRPPYKGVDLEAGGRDRPPYPVMVESLEIRWAFILKVYSILSIQLIMTIAVSSVVISVRPISHFFVYGEGLGLYLFLIVLPMLVSIPMYFYHQRHPANLILLTLFTVCLRFAVGLTCAFTRGEVILEAVILTATVFVSLTLYTF